MTTPLSEPHAHMLDPTWSQEPIPWAEAADDTMVPRIHAACLDDCWDCLNSLALETIASAETTAAVMTMGFGIYAMLTPSKRPKVEESLEYAPAFLKMLHHVQASGDEGVQGPEVLGMVRTFDLKGRWQITDASIQLMGLYTEVLQKKEA